MKLTDYHRLRRYQEVLTVWSSINTLLNTSTKTELDQMPEELPVAWRALQRWLVKEQEYFESIVEETP